MVHSVPQAEGIRTAADRVRNAVLRRGSPRRQEAEGPVPLIRRRHIDRAHAGVHCGSRKVIRQGQRLRGSGERLGQHRQLLRGAVAVFGVDGLVDAGNHHRRVAGELAGSVDGVPVPGAIGQAGLGDERASRSGAGRRLSWARSPEGAICRPWACSAARQSGGGSLRGSKVERSRDPASLGLALGRINIGAIARA